MTTTSSNYETINKLVNSYNSIQKNYKINLLILKDEEVKNYQFRSDAFNSDLITFDNYVVANSYSDKLLDLSKENLVYKYQVSIISSLKTNNGKLHCIPSIGKFYSNCYNIDLFKENNYTIPNTMDEFIDLIKRMDIRLDMSANIYKSSSTISSYDSIIFSLMQIAYPLLLSSTEGNKFIHDYYYGNSSILNSSTKSSWEKVFKLLYQFYDYNYYSLNDINSSFFNELYMFNNKETMAMQNSCENDIENLISQSINFEFFPFVGELEDEQIILSKPLFYLSILDNVPLANKQGAIDFLNYFSSNEGQNIITSAQSDNNSISYINNTFLSLNEKYQNFEQVIKRGRVFIPDIFFSSFNNFSQYIYKYLNNELSLGDMFKAFDDRIKELNSTNIEQYKVNKTFDYSSNVNKKETAIGNYICDSLRSYAITSTCVIPSNIILENIYEKGLSTEDISIILANCDVNKVLIKVSELKKLIKNNLNVDGYIPLISNITLKKNQDDIDIYKINGQKYDDNENITALIYSEWLNNNDESKSLFIEYSLLIGKKYSVRELFSSYLKNCNQIIKPSLDGRYGDTL